jgi:hypothetical protein
MSIPFEFNTGLFIKRDQDATLNDIVCQDISVNGTASIHETIIIEDKTIQGDLDVEGATTLNTLDVTGASDFTNTLTASGTKDFTTGLLNLGATTMNSNIVGSGHNIATLGVLSTATLNATDIYTTDISALGWTETMDLSCNSRGQIQQLGVNVYNDEAHAQGNNVLKIAGHTNINNFTDDITDEKSAQLVLGHVNSDQYIKFYTCRVDGIGSSFIDFKNINATATDVDRLTFKYDGSSIGYLDRTGLINVNEVDIDNTSGDEPFIKMNTDLGGEIASFKSYALSGISTRGVDLSMSGFNDSKTTEIFFSTDLEKNSWIDCSNLGIQTRDPQATLDVSGSIKIGTTSQLRGGGSNNNSTADNNYIVMNANPTSHSSAKIVLRRDNGNFYGGEVLGGLPTGTTSSPDDLQDNERLAFNTVGGGNATRVMSFINTGFCGMGTTTPLGNLHVSTSGQDLQFKDTQLYLQGDPATPSGKTEKLRIVADSVGENILFKMLNNTSTSDSQHTHFFTGNIERTGAGIKVANSTYKGQRLEAKQPLLSAADTEDALAFYFYGDATTTETGSLTVDFDGNMAISGSYSPSDLNIKENVVDASLNNLVSDFQKVRFVNFNMIDDKKKLKKLGVISQEIKEIYPTAVVEKNVRDDDDNITGTRQYVKYDVLYLKSCLVVQHLLTEIESLKTELADYKTSTDTEIADLKTTITNLESQVNVNQAQLVTNGNILLKLQEKVGL